jgi:hypothetical protein
VHGSEHDEVRHLRRGHAPAHHREHAIERVDRRRIPAARAIGDMIRNEARIGAIAAEHRFDERHVGGKIRHEHDHVFGYDGVVAPREQGEELVMQDFHLAHRSVARVNGDGRLREIRRQASEEPRAIGWLAEVVRDELDPPRGRRIPEHLVELGAEAAERSQERDFIGPRRRPRPKLEEVNVRVARERDEHANEKWRQRRQAEERNPRRQARRRERRVEPREELVFEVRYVPSPEPLAHAPKEQRLEALVLGDARRSAALEASHPVRPVGEVLVENRRKLR